MMKKKRNRFTAWFMRCGACFRAGLVAVAAVKISLLVFAAAFLLLSAGCTDETSDSANNGSGNGATHDQITNGGTVSRGDGNHGVARVPGIGEFDEDLVFATLSGMDIKVGEFLFFRSVIVERLLGSAGVLPGSEDEVLFWRSEVSDGMTMAEYAMNTALDELVRFKVLSLYVEEHGSVTNDTRMEIRGFLVDLADEFGGPDAFTAHVEAMHGISRVLFLSLFEQSLMQESFFEEQLNNIEISDEEALAEYNDSAEAYEIVTVSHILFFHEGRGSGESMRLAEEMLQRAVAGESMRSLALSFSEDPWVSENGGAYTFSRFDTFDPEFIEWSFDANIGDFGVIETILGSHVMKLENKSVEPFESVKEGIVHYLKDSRLNDKLEEWFSLPRFQDFELDEDILATMAW